MGCGIGIAVGPTIEVFRGFDPRQIGSLSLWLDSRFGVTQQPTPLIDGDMELPDTSAWIAANAAILTKQGNAHSGNRCLRVAYDGMGNPLAKQFVIVTGNIYTVTGYGRSDGTSRPAIYCGSATLFEGSTSTLWQLMSSGVFTAVATDLKLYCTYAVPGVYSEFDDFVLTPLHVSTWQDLSPYTRVLNQTTQGNQPNTATSGVITFDSSNDALAFVPFSQASSCTVYAVVKKASVANGTRNLLTGSTNLNVRLYGAADGTKACVYDGATERAAVALDTNKSILRVRWNGSLVGCRVNMNAEVTENTIVAPANWSTISSTTASMNAQLSSLCIFNEDVEANGWDRLMMEYLSKTHGITL